jgi:hypothetical protein
MKSRVHAIAGCRGCLIPRTRGKGFDDVPSCTLVAQTSNM